MAIQIVVLIQPVPDLAKASVSKSQALLVEKGPRLMNPADRNALEFALQIRDHAPGGRGTVSTVMLAPSDAEAILKEALALEADQAIILSDPAFLGGDAAATAVALAAAASKLKADLILSGEGVVGHRVAEALKLPSVSSVTGIAFDGELLRLTSKADSETKTFTASLPVLLSVPAGSNTPRIANAIKIMKAAKREILRWRPVDLGLSENEIGSAAAGTVPTRSFLPESIST